VTVEPIGAIAPNFISATPQVASPPHATLHGGPPHATLHGGPPHATLHGGPGFSDLFAQGLGEVNRQLVASQSELQGLANGEAANLHQVMIRLEETRLGFQLMVQVRNRLLEAYQDVMRMQI
jgi:flagellar hook-basal body complex protein FliE